MKDKLKPHPIEPLSEECDLGILKEMFYTKIWLYGNINIDVLDLSPKFGLLEKVNPTNCLISVEKCLNQIRWRKHIGKEKDRKFLYDNEDKEVE